MTHHSSAPLRVPSRPRPAPRPPADVCSPGLHRPLLHRVSPLAAWWLGPYESDADPGQDVMRDLLGRLHVVDPNLRLVVEEYGPVLYAAECGSMSVVACGQTRLPDWQHCVACWEPPLDFSHTCHTWVR